MTDKTDKVIGDAVEKKAPTATEQRLSRRQALLGALVAGAATLKASEAAAATGADCSCLPAPDCNAVCPNGGAPRGDGTQACECFENPPMPTLAKVAYTGKYSDLIDAPDPNQMGAKLDDIVKAGSAGLNNDVTLSQKVQKGQIQQSFNGKIAVPYFQVNAQGRITSYATRTVTFVENYYNYYNYYVYSDYNCNDGE